MDERRADAGEVAELRALLGQALARIDELEVRVTRGAPSTVAIPVPVPHSAGVVVPASPVNDRLMGRRQALKGVALAAGAATAGLVLGDATPAAAIDGDPMKIGYSNTEGNGTSVTMDSVGSGSGFTVFDGQSLHDPNRFAAIKGVGRGNRVAVGVWGLGTITGDGVIGEVTGSGIGVHGIAIGNVAVAGDSQSSYGVSGTSQSNVGVFGSTATSTSAGVWGQSTSGTGVHGKSTSNVGVYGEADSSYGVSGKSNSNIGVYGNTAGSSYAGVWGDGAAAQGVHGRTVTGAGVYGESTSTTTGYGVQAYSAGSVGLKAVGKTFGAVAQSVSTSPTDAALYASSLQANAIGANTDSGLVLTGYSDTGGGIEVKAPTFHFRMGNKTTRNAPTADAFAHQAGEIVYASNGETWVCVKGGTPGTWRKVAGQATAGAFHVLPAPARIYDSRAGSQPAQGPKTKLAGNVARTLDCTVNNSGVPVGATAVSITVLLVNAANASGNLTIWANGAARPASNTIVWGAGSGRYTTSTISALDAAAKIQVSASAATDLVLDIVGYYR